MNAKPTALCIIPARGGSKRIPRKNIRPFLGRPIISYAIAAALESGCYDEVMVSTDDEEIARIAVEHGASVPFMRSAATSHDKSNFVEVLIEVVDEYRARGREFDLVCCVYPTAVLTRAETLRAGMELLASDESLSCVLSIQPFGYPIQRAVYQKEGRLQMFQPEHYHSRSQDLVPAFHDAGQWYWLRVARLHLEINMLGAQTAPIVLSETDVQDIDNEDDWRMAELKYTMRADPG